MKHRLLILGVIMGLAVAMPRAHAGQEVKPGAGSQAGTVQAGTVQPGATQAGKRVTDVKLNSVWADGCRLWVRVENSGNVKIDKVLREQVWVDGVLKDDSKMHYVLEPGAVFAHGVGADPGVKITGFNKVVRAFVDAENVLAELNEANNNKQVTLSCRLASEAQPSVLVGKPDLVVSFEFKNISRKDPNADGKYVWTADIEFTVTNQGTADAGPCIIHLEQGSGPEGASSSAGPDISIPGIGAGKSFASVTGPYQHAGAPPVYRATVDAGHSVLESNENNNQFTKPFPS